MGKGYFYEIKVKFWFQRPLWFTQPITFKNGNKNKNNEQHDIKTICLLNQNAEQLLIATMLRLLNVTPYGE